MTTPLALAAALLLMQTSSRFDLICQGSVTAETITVAGVRLAPTTGDWHQRYAIDLERRLFCIEGCRVPRTIVHISPSEIVLMSDDVGPSMFGLFLDRVDGTLTQLSADPENGGLLTGKVEARCRRAPFTPFPQSQF